MKWFKHVSDSLDDPFIFDLIEKHDANGYLVFFGILEIYAREFKTETTWKLQVTLPYLRKKLNRTRNKLITNVLETLKNSGKWQVHIVGDNICIFIPKFKELMDESTLKKLRENEKSFRNDSGLIPPDAPTDIDKDLDIDKDIKKLKDKDAFFIHLKAALNKTKERYPSPVEQRAIQLFCETNAHSKNRDAVLHCITRLVESKEKVILIKNFLDKILLIENGKHNAAESEEESNRHKSEGIPEGVGKILSGIGKPLPAGG